MQAQNLLFDKKDIPADLMEFFEPADCNACYICHSMLVLDELWRVLRKDGTCWWNLGDSYANTGGHTKQGENSQRKGRSNVESQNAVKGIIPDGLKPKDLCLVPYRFALAAQARGWWIRSAIIWEKNNPMPESVTDRPTNSYELIYLMTKSARYFYDSEAVRIRAGISAVVQGPNLGNQEVVFQPNMRLQKSPPEQSLTPSGMSYNGGFLGKCIQVATSILNAAQSQNDFSLALLDSQEWQDFRQNSDGGFICGAPPKYWPVILGHKLMTGEGSAKGFLEQLHNVVMRVGYRDDFGVARILASVFNSPSVDTDGDAPLSVNNSGEVGQQDVFFSHNKEYTTSTYTSSSHNLRDVWRFPTSPYKEAHFATFPEELPRRCILAGCPEKVCAKCGAGWIRIIESTRENKSYWAQQGKTVDDVAELGKYGAKDQNGNPTFQRKDYDIRLGPTVNNKTLGWKPSCSCGTEETKKGICLDPFSGSGTVCDVATRSGRIGIGVELSRKYIKLSMKRTESSRRQGVLL